MLKRNLLILYIFMISNFNHMYAMIASFAEFKSNIVGKSATEVYAYITPKLKDGLDRQVDYLRDHMVKHGHFGYKLTISRRNTPMNWSTFFIKSDNSFFLDSEEQRDRIKTIWNARTLTYSCDIPGCSNGLCLNGSVPNLSGVVFDNKSAPRSSIAARDIFRYKRENELAVIVARLNRAPEARDFSNSEDLEIATEVFNARPRIVDSCSIRIILILPNDNVEFNTLYPF